MTDAFTLSDGAARRQAVAAGGCVVVQAPAGSGKTTLLAQRYLRHLASVDSPERILALTFTRRAAQEMRERVIQALRNASLPDCPADFERQTWELAVAAKSHMEGLEVDIERHPSRLRVETIDAFNGWLAAQLPVAAGAGARLTVLENAEPLYAEAARRALAHEAAQDAADAFGGAVERVLALGDQRWRRLLEMIAGMLPSRDRWLPKLAGALRAASALDEARLLRMRRHFDEDLACLVTRTLREAHEILGAERIAALTPLLRAAAERLGSQRPELAAWINDENPLEPIAQHIERWRGLAALCLTNESTIRKRLTTSEGFPPQCAEKPAMLDLLAEFARDPEAVRALGNMSALPESAYGDDDWARVRDVAQVLVLAAAELDQVFRERGVVDFPAVSMAALRALGTSGAPTDLSLRLDYQVQHILVDEFQDTSSAQMELIRLLTAGWQRGDGRSVFCVGDPMQSIYGFRDAEVRAFLGLAEQGIGDLAFELQSLSSNFRSAPAVVEWINHCFARVMPRVDDRDRGAIAYRASRSALTASAIADPGVTLRGFATRQAEARAVAELIESRRRQHPDWRIAVLVRARTHAREIAHGLRTRGIDFRAVDIELLQDRPAVRDVIMLLRALLHLGDRTAWLAVLRAPWAGLALSDLLAVARAAPIVWDVLRDDAVLGGLSAQGNARSLRLRAVLETAFQVQNEGTVTRWVERTWLALGGAACLASAHELEHVRAVFVRLRELERLGLPDAAYLTQSFSDLCAEDARASAVEIMTIHKAKGLEFDMVVLPALDRPTRSNPDPMMLAHQYARPGHDGIVMAARPAIGAEKDRLFEFLRQQMREAAGLEAERLLYVACTRAKWQLHLTATTARAQSDPANGAEQGTPGDPAVRGTANGEAANGEAASRNTGAEREPWRPRSGSLLAVIWPIVEGEFCAAAADRAPGQGPAQAAEATEPAARRGGPLCRVPLDWSPAALRAPPLAGVMPSASAREETPIFDWAGEVARREGTLVHAELQVMDLASSEEASIRARDAHFRRWLALHGVPEERVHEASARVVAALIAVLRDPRGRWIMQQRPRGDLREYAVSGHSRGEVVRAVFDRSFIDESGVRWVIDYKTSHHGGGAREDFLDREVERYRPQLERYALLARKLGPEPVRVGLYFPLMRAWREWAPA